MRSAAELRRALDMRAHAYALIRRFFVERGVLEVETPILSEAGNTEPNIESFSTHFSGASAAGSTERWMRTSPEHALKRLLAAGVGDCYELGRVFRNGEAGLRHNPEFTMLEWYRLGWDHHRLIEETIDLATIAMASVGREVSVVRCSYRDLFLREIGIDPFTASLETLRLPLAGIRIEGDGLSRDDWLDLLITHRLQPGFPNDRITAVHDFPASQCVLAKIRGGEFPVAERFELYLGANELANGYHELTDPIEQRRRFELDNVRRHSRGQRPMPVDQRFIEALERLPSCSGVALGIERLLMCMTGTDAIADVMAFPFAQA